MEQLPTTVEETQKLLVSKTVTAVDLANAFLARINEVDSEIHAYLEVFEDVLDQAKRADEMRADGFSHPLLGVPVSIKDNILFQGHQASAGSKILGNYIASYSSNVVEKLRDAGAVILGRVNMDEFALGSSCEYSAYGPTRNPLDLERVPGGSSGGVSASVAGGMAVVSIGTDTGGSVRLPASFCGMCGLYPTYGSCSRYGLIAMASSLDQPGPIGKTVDDCKAVFDTISGFDDRDAQCIPDGERIEQSSDAKIIGVPRSMIEMEGVSQAVKDNFNAVIEKLSSEGYEIRDIELPMMKNAVQVYYIIVPAEVSTNLSRMDGMRFGVREAGDDLFSTYMNSKGEGFGPETQRRLLLGAYVLSAGYKDAYFRKATEVRELMRKEFTDALSEVDVILTPTTTMGAFKLGEVADPVAMYMMDLFTIPANLTGLPALSIPHGVDENSMPLGIQVMGPRFAEERLFKVGRVIEKLR